MVIKASAAAEIRALVETLRDGDEVRREAAVARLGVIGPRAVDRLVSAWATADGPMRRALLRVLEPMADPRSLPIAREALAGPPDLAVDAVAVLRRLLTGASPAANGALDALMAVALDETGPPARRDAARDALADVAPDVRAGFLDMSRPVSRPPRAPTRTDAPPPAPPRTLWDEALDGRLPDAPDALRAAMQKHAASAPLTALHTLVDRIRAREEASPETAEAWRTLRGTVHQALAKRDSRVALYDLRESLAAARGPLPVSFLAALQTIGDASCLEAIAQAYAQSAPSEGWWRTQLAAAFRAITSREKLTRRSAAVKKAITRWPEITERF